MSETVFREVSENLEPVERGTADGAAEAAETWLKIPRRDLRFGLAGGDAR